MNELLTGLAAGAGGMWGLSKGLARLGRDPGRPPELYEYFLDNFWFETIDLEHQEINEPLRGSHKADIVILGGGFTGLSSAYNLRRRFPDKKVVVLEGACCGYGASGRNGGFAGAGIPGLMKYVEKMGPEAGRRAYDASFHGLEQIREVIAEHAVECDFEEKGELHAAISEEHAKHLEKECETYRSMGFDADLVQGKELEAEVRSPRYVAAMKFPYGAMLNPAKLARGMKRVVESAGVEVRERTVVVRVTPGKVHRIETELGEISAPTLVLGLNGYLPQARLLPQPRPAALQLCHSHRAAEQDAVGSHRLAESAGTIGPTGSLHISAPHGGRTHRDRGSGLSILRQRWPELREQQAGHRAPDEGSVHHLPPTGRPAHTIMPGEAPWDSPWISCPRWE